MRLLATRWQAVLCAQDMDMGMGMDMGMDMVMGMGHASLARGTRAREGEDARLGEA